jgi:ElaB/YqjD/DUF883 family membrane-anchored ribosome-binding protein
MNEEINRIQGNVDNITDDAKSLLDATADVASEKVVQARNRLTSALEAAKDAYATVQKKTVESAKATDKVIRENPYQAIGIAFAVGVLVGFLWNRRDR